MRKAKPAKEGDIQRAILDWLNVGYRDRCLAFRVNTVGIWDPIKKIYRKNPSLTKGVSDILVCWENGIFIAIECKVPGKRPSEDQKIFLEKIENKGGIAVVATSIDDVRHALIKHDLI